MMTSTWLFIFFQIFNLLGVSCEPLESLLGASWELLGVSWEPLGSSWGSLGSSWECCGTLGRPRGNHLGDLGVLLRTLGALLEHS